MRRDGSILREYLKGLTLAGSSDQLLLRWARRLRVGATHELGLQASIRYGIRFQEAIPSELWGSREGPLGEFMKGEWRIWLDETAQKISELQELDQWIASLKNRPQASD